MKTKKEILYLLLFIGLILGMQSCRKVTLQLEKIPENTPPGSVIYVTGNFNFWDPGDERYTLDFDDENGYSITLPVTFGKIEYKFTRGDWSTVERDRCGNDIENRLIDDVQNPLIPIRIESWADQEPLDCDSVKIILTRIPENTPEEGPIKIAGNFNAWNPGSDSLYLFKKDLKTGYYSLIIKKEPGLLLKDFRYKIVRNEISESESDKYGNEIETRKIDLSNVENLIEVENWFDLAEPALNAITIILKRIPQTTPENCRIYLVGNFNNWNPGDQNYIFRKRPNGLYAISIPRQKYGLSFKVTRGNWQSEAADIRGVKFENMDFSYSEIDTVFLEIDNWKDLKPKWSDFFTFVIDELPQLTPRDQGIYLVGTYDEWGTQEGPYVFSKNDKGKYSCSVKKKTGGDFEYKITRGNWKTQVIFEKPPKIAFPWDDTLRINIAKWSDQLKNKEDYIRIEISKLPGNTPDNAQIFITGAFNGWNPGDKDYILQKDKNGLLTILLPKAWLREGFKFTMGSWQKVEGDRNGRYIENRFYKQNAGNLKISINGWEDR